MAIAKATAESLTQFSSILKDNREDILSVKRSMDRELLNFLWDDPVGAAFRADYQEKLKPIENTLVPNLASYSTYLDQEASIINEYGAK
jgi:hypothetical protein